MEDDDDSDVHGIGNFFWLGGGEVVPRMVGPSKAEAGSQITFEEWVEEFLGAAYANQWSVRRETRG